MTTHDYYMHTTPLIHFQMHTTIIQNAWVGHSYMYLIIHMRRKGMYHGVIYLRNWTSLHRISTN